MMSSKKGVSISVIISLIAGLALLAILLNAMGFFKGANKDLHAANSCTTIGGACVASPSQCNSLALKGYNCAEDMPYCCQDQQYTQCTNSTWNTCESCQVKTTNAVYLGSGKNGEAFKVKCAYNANDAPCSKMTLSGRGMVLASDFCSVNTKQSTDGEVVYDCPGTLLPGDYTITCGLNAKGTSGVDEKKTCCVSSQNKDSKVDFKVS